MAKRVQVVLSEDILSLGKDGDLVEVAPGYARNFLLPHGKALPVTPAVLKQVEHRRAKEAERLAALKADAVAFRTALDTIGRFTVKKQTGGDDVLFDKPNHAAHMRAALPADDDDSDAEREAAEGTSDDDSKESGQDATNADSFVDDPEVIKTIETRFPFHRCVPVAPLGAGTAVAWAGNTLHWGSSCAAEPPPHVFPPAPPRRSIAFTFRRSGAKVHRASSREGPITRSEAEAGVPDIERRFRIVMQSIVLYSQWIDMSLCVPREYCLET